MHATFTDAQAMARAHPDTFEAPGAAELARVGPGSLVKVCASDCERFWVEVSGRVADTLFGTVDNDLLYTDQHGLALGDRVAFELRHIYDVWPETPAAAAPPAAG